MSITLHGTRASNTDVITPDTTGRLLNIVSEQTNSTISSTSTSPVSSGLTATITPKSVDSKFLIMTTGGNVFPSSEQTEIHIYHYVSVGGATAQAVIDSEPRGLIRNGLVGGSEQKGMQSTLSFYDANTTSQLIFVPYFKSSNSGSTAHFNQGSVYVQLTVMEFSG